MVGKQTKSGRRSVLKAIGTTSVAGLAGCAANTNSQNKNAENDSNATKGTDYPSEDITSLVPFATGGGFDAYSRLAQPYWEEYLPNDASVVVENVAGGGGVRGATQTYNANPDGHTFMIWDTLQATANQIGRKVGYDIREMSHIGAVTQSPNALIAMKSAEVKSWEDFVNRVSNLNFATQGVGSGAHVGMILLAEITGEFSREDLNFVHYEGTGPALSGLERGEADMFMVSTSTSGLKVVSALNAEMFICFSDPETGSYFSEAAANFSSEMDINNVGRFAELTVFRRFFTGPPDVPDDILGIQREAFNKIIEDKKFLNKSDEAQRPIINPGGADHVNSIIDNQFKAFNSSSIKSTLQNIFSS